MKLYNIEKKEEEVNFSQALIRGLGENQGLFFPKNLPNLSSSEISSLLKMNFIERSAKILLTYINDEFSMEEVFNWVKIAFNFPIPLQFIHNNIAILELFHGPTLAFKDFGCRLMAQMLNYVSMKCDKPMVILTATSGDTGAAVAHAFYGCPNIRVIILYPKNKIGILQEKMFSTLGKNIFTISIDGDFDACQNLVKLAFSDIFLKNSLYLNSANSINISRLLAQICYYFEAISKLLDYNDKNYKNCVVSVPSGNFGNLTSGLLAKSLGLLIKRFIAATNLNDTVPRFLRTGKWNPRPTISTLSNAMDVSIPSNWVRVEELLRQKNWTRTLLGYGCVSDEVICRTIQEVFVLGYITEPHTAVAYRLLKDQLCSDEFGICLGTAHPAKFKDLIEKILKEKTQIILPSSLEKYINLPSLSYSLPNKFSLLRDLILHLIS